MRLILYAAVMMIYWTFVTSRTTKIFHFTIFIVLFVSFGNNLYAQNISIDTVSISDNKIFIGGEANISEETEIWILLNYDSGELTSTRWKPIKTVSILHNRSVNWNESIIFSSNLVNNNEIFIAIQECDSLDHQRFNENYGDETTLSFRFNPAINKILVQ